MLKHITKFSIFLLFFSCSVGAKFESEFKDHIASSDSILYEGDFLHPVYAYIKKGNLIGIESIGKGECVQVSTRYFINQSGKIEKIVCEKDFWNEESCGEIFDSVYVIEPVKGTVKVYTKTTDGKLVNNKGLIEDELSRFKGYKNAIKNWERKL
jgi:hypothetical protein